MVFRSCQLALQPKRLIARRPSGRTCIQKVGMQDNVVCGRSSRPVNSDRTEGELSAAELIVGMALQSRPLSRMEVSDLRHRVPTIPGPSIRESVPEILER